MARRWTGWIIVLVVLGAGAYPAAAQYNRPGSTSAEFLRIGVSARAAGMGEAYLASVRGAEGTYYNPSALPWLEGGMNVYLNHTSWFAGINHEFIAAAKSFGFGALGASVTALYTDEMDVTTPVEQGGTGETFYATNMRVNVSYARYMTNRVTLGVSANYVDLRLYDGLNAKAFAVDIASTYRADFRDFRFGLMIANLGNEVEFVSEAYPLPVNFRFGMQANVVDMSSHVLRVSGEAIKPNDGAPIGQVGLEYGFQNLFFLRSGYRLNYDVATVSFGGGVALDVGDRALIADYGYSAFGQLGVAHRFSIGLDL